MKKAKLFITMFLFMFAIAAAIAENALVLDIPNRENTTTMGVGCDDCTPVTAVNCIPQQLDNEPRCKCQLGNQNIVNAFNTGCNALWEDPNSF